jgi:hypothetical protein
MFKIRSRTAAAVFLCLKSAAAPQPQSLQPQPLRNRIKLEKTYPQPHRSRNIFFYSRMLAAFYPQAIRMLSICIRQSFFDYLVYNVLTYIRID